MSTSWVELDLLTRPTIFSSAMKISATWCGTLNTLPVSDEQTLNGKFRFRIFCSTKILSHCYQYFWGYATLTQLICISLVWKLKIWIICVAIKLNNLHSTDWKRRKLLTIRILIITMEQKPNITLDFCLLWGSTLKCWESRVKRTCHTCRYSSWQAASLVIAEIGSHSCFVVYHGCWLYSADHK